MRTIGLSFNVYISNKIGTEAVGIYQLIMSIYLFAITLANSGIHLASTRIVSEQLAFGFETGIKKAVRKCLFYSLFMGLFSCLLLFFLSPWISAIWLHGKISSMPLRILAFSLPFLAMSSSMQGYFSAMRNVKKNCFFTNCRTGFTNLFSNLFSKFLYARRFGICLSFFSLRFYLI